MNVLRVPAPSSAELATRRRSLPRRVLSLPFLVLLLLAGCGTTRPPREPGPPVGPAEGAPANGAAGAEPELYDRLHEQLATGDAQGALAAYERAVPEGPGGAEQRLLHARLRMLAGDLAGARLELEALRGESPRDPEVLFNLGLVAGLQGEAEAQRALMDEVLALEAGHQGALATRGELYLQEDNLSEAERCFTAALSGQPDGAAALLGLAEVRYRRKRWPEALELLDRAVRVQPDLPYAWLDRARVKRAQENYLGAIADVSEALRLDPQDYWARLDRGEMYLKVRKREQARLDFSEAIRLQPQQFPAYAYLAGLDYEEGRQEEALGGYEQVLRLRPDYTFAYAPLGVLYYVRRDWGGAERMFRAALEQQPREYSLALLLYLARRQGEPMGTKSRAALSAALARFPRPSWLYDVGRYLLEPGGGSELALLDRLQQEKNTFLRGQMLFYLAAQYRLSGRERAARSCLLEARDRMRPDFPERRIADWLLKTEGM